MQKKIERKYPYGAVWLSHSSLSDFNKCQRLYYLRNVYKDPKTYRKIQVVNPYLSLGAAVHDTIASISLLPKVERFKKSLSDSFEERWRVVSGKIGGFASKEQEEKFKERGLAMIRRVEENPGPLSRLALKIREKIPSIWLSESDNLVLCGVIDWIELLPNNTLHIIDFKTGKSGGDEGSLQLPIYFLIVKNKMKRPVSKLSFWYLDIEDSPREAPFPEIKGVIDQLIEKGKKIKELRSQRVVLCAKGGCRYCSEYEAVFQGKAEHVGLDRKMNKDLYLIK